MKSIVYRSSFTRILAVATLALSSTACHNYTIAPVCNKHNASLPTGITGSYTLSLQEEDFSVSSVQIDVFAEQSEGQTVLRKVSPSASEESSLCHVNGHLVIESLDEDLQLYSQERLYVTAMGITTLPMFYDRAALDAAAVPYSIIEVPANVERVIGKRASAAFGAALTRVVSMAAILTDEEPVHGIVIDNTAVTSNALMSHAHAAPVGVTFLRK